MQTKGVATLIYMAKTHDSTDGSPINLEISKEVKVDIQKTFSSGYYFERGREMRDACNLVVNEYHVKDIEEDGLLYELSYVVFKGMRYKVMSIMNHYYNYQDDPYRKVLDLKKVSNA